MLSLCFWVTLLFAILFAMASMDATGQCYCDPCDTSSPAITGGVSLVTAMVAFIFIAQVRLAAVDLETKAILRPRKCCVDVLLRK